MHILIGLIIAFIVVALLSNRKTRHCRWREYRQEMGSRWRCVHCGHEIMGAQGQTPKRCLRSQEE